jgi:hypothetical protein
MNEQTASNNYYQKSSRRIIARTVMQKHNKNLTLCGEITCCRSWCNRCWWHYRTKHSDSVFPNNWSRFMKMEMLPYIRCLLKPSRGTPGRFWYVRRQRF